MKALISICLIIGLVLPNLPGCAGAGKNRVRQTSAVSLYQWLERDAFPEIAKRLRTDSFLKGRPLIIVGANNHIPGWTVNDRIDALTSEVRRRLVSVLLQYPDIRLVRRYPVAAPIPFGRLVEQRCGNMLEPELLMTINIKLSDRSHTDLASVDIRAIDVRKANWVNGFSVHGTVALTPEQRTALSVIEQDVQLKGFKMMPFSEDEQDEMAVYLSGQLNCLLKDASGGREISVFVDIPKTPFKGHDTAWFLEKQLLLLNDIQLTRHRNDADWILIPEVKTISSRTGLAQFWVEAYERQDELWIKGVAAHAYFLTEKTRRMGIAGRWEVIDLPSQLVSGEMEIRQIAPDDYRGDLLDSDGNAILKGCIFICLKNERVNWTYYDERHHRTVHASGRLLEGNRRIIVRISSFPSSGNVLKRQLVLKEQIS